jgi:hypothetical protein
MHGNIVTASLLAILSAVNRAVAQDALPARSSRWTAESRHAG